ncbi:MAG: hypothetical protein HYU66_00615, partial [Armatimonadetes bacterium]|nr:hypothetical protein [Armatimonadota bacterium]
HVKQAQLLVRKAAERLHMTRDELAEVAHRKLGVASLNDVTPEQADEVIAWLEPFVTGDA